LFATIRELRGQIFLRIEPLHAVVTEIPGTLRLHLFRRLGVQSFRQPDEAPVLQKLAFEDGGGLMEDRR